MTDSLNLPKEFYRIMKYNREELPSFLEAHGTYDNMKNYIQTIEEQKHNRNIFSDMCLGKVGNENNKQWALYELPTHELVDVINTIATLLNIDTVEEICAGQGLLAKMLKLRTPLNVSASDGKQWIQTFSNTTYVDVASKLIESYVYENDTYENKLLIASWIPEKGINSVMELLRNKLNQFIIIGERYNKNVSTIIDKAKQLNYRVINIPVKQICYRDYYNDNMFFPNDSCRSSVTLFLQNNEHIHLDNIMECSKIGNFCNRLKEYSDKMYLQDLVIKKTLPSWSMDVLLNHETERELVMFVKNISECFMNKYKIPTYLRNNDEFKFWLTQQNQGFYPLAINKHSKFVEYREQMEILESDLGFQELVNRKILPQWVPNAQAAKHCIWLDFSSNYKNWKESYHMFVNELRLQGRII